MVKTNKPKKSDLKKLKQVEVKKKKEESKKKIGVLNIEALKGLSKEEKKVEKIEAVENLDSIGREEKKRKEHEALEQLQNLDKNKIFEETKEFSIEPPEIIEEKIDNLEHFASTLPSTIRQEEQFNTPYATNTSASYGISSTSYSANSSYSPAGSYSSGGLNNVPSLARNRSTIPAEPEFRNSQMDYELRKKEEFERSMNERKHEKEESQGHPMQRKSRRMGI